MNGVVIKSTGSWYHVIAESGEKIKCRIKGKFRINDSRTTNPVAVGDHVRFNMEEETATGVIDEIKERKNYIIRKATKLSKQSHIIAANIDQALVIVTLAMPRTSTGFIDRFLLTAEAYGIPAGIIFNKTDLYTEDGMEEISLLEKTYEPLGYRCIRVSATEKTGIENLRSILKDKVSLISGHSGVGKSTLINVIEPGLNLKTSDISEIHEKGMHTTTFAEMFPLAGGGFIIDTPGIKEFGLIHMKKQELGHFFPEIRSRMNQCKFNSCLHVNEPKCAIIAAVEKGDIALSRYNSYLSILNSDELEKEHEN